jgi:phosphoribosyl 1,2-cyclic phosphodiesterase
VEEMLLHQLHPDHFPVSLEDDDIKAEFEFLPLEGAVKIGPITVRHHYVNHVPAGTVVGFRADSPDGSLVYIPDIEPYGFECKLGCAKDPKHLSDERGLIEFVRDADVMVFGTMFTENDYEQYKGWGHSPVEYALEVAAEAGVKKLGLFHYAPNRKDEEIDRFVEHYAPRARKRGVELFATREGMVIEIGGKDS